MTPDFNKFIYPAIDAIDYSLYAEKKFLVTDQNIDEIGAAIKAYALGDIRHSPDIDVACKILESALDGCAFTLNMRAIEKLEAVMCDVMMDLEESDAYGVEARIEAEIKFDDMLYDVMFRRAHIQKITGQTSSLG